MTDEFADGESLPEESPLDSAAENLPAAPDENAERKEEIRELMADTRGPYWNGPKAERLQAEYRNLLGAEVPPGSNAAQADNDLFEVAGSRTPTLAEAESWGLDAVAGTESVNRAMTILDQVPKADREGLEISLGGLSDGTRAAMVAELSRPRSEVVNHRTHDACAEALKDLEWKGCGPLLAEWGIGAPRRVGIARDRINQVIDSIPSDEEAAEFVRWFDNLTGPEMTAILRATA